MRSTFNAPAYREGRLLTELVMALRDSRKSERTGHLAWFQNNQVLATGLITLLVSMFTFYGTSILEN